MSDRNEPPSEEANVNKANFTTCAKCGLLIVGQFVRALGGTYHLECFKCQDCGAIVASKFFPIEGSDGKQQPLCERDYFRRLNLICENCGGALRGSYITALDKKYHIEHFTCSACPTVFGPQDSYYEHDSQFVEINRNNVDEHWHPECYMIHKFWNVRLSTRTDYDQNAEADDPSTEVDTKLTPEELKQQQKEMEEKVYNIWTVLSAFEEMSAACISDMLLHVSNGSYPECVKMSERFVSHVEVLFSSIDDLEIQSVQASGQGLQYHREAKMLCKKIQNFFSLLGDAHKSGIKKLGISQDLLALVTGLAQFLKVLIRIALTGALKLERDFNGAVAIENFLTKLGEFTKKNGKQIEEENIDNEISCSGCSRELRTIYRDATFNQITEMAFCPNDTNEQAAPGFQHVTQLEQYIYLLRVALSNLNGQLKQDEDGNGLPNREGRHENKTGKEKEETALTADIKRMKSVHLDRKLTNPSNALRAKIIKQEQLPSLLKNSDESASSKNKSATDLSQRHVKIADDQLLEVPAQDIHLKFDEETIALSDISAIAAAEMAASEGSTAEKKNKARKSSRAKLYLSELSALEYFIVRHAAVLCMEQLLKDYCTLEELLELIGSKKATLWNKFMTSIKSTDKKPVKKKGTFGIPLEVLVEKYGVDSVLGADTVTTNHNPNSDGLSIKDMSVEGIFRKNGNIRRLKDLSEAIDKNPSSVNLSEDNPVQSNETLIPKLYSNFTRSPTQGINLNLNRDTMEVLFIFFKWVASFSHVDEETGSKMDLHNLATVITPNILYSKSKDPIKDDSFLAIEAVHGLLKYQDEFWEVPEEISMILRDQELLSNPENLTTKDILKRCENLVKPRRLGGGDSNDSNSSGEEIPFGKRANEYPYKGNEGENKSSSNLPVGSTSLPTEASITIEQRADDPAAIAEQKKKRTFKKSDI
ncbi:5156_t:CDS:10 [Acaulospora colombiana]|uniref:5156_t:CDS:1 n=1 Tax=Acaulospora colombiana TaxID=27376 RepID=A0ACA9L8K9_9GLOM|nr:5156_t:CDS:10 [Acaulospora colombiana]